MRPNRSENALKLGVKIHVLSYALGVVAQVVLWWLLTPDIFFWPLWSMVGWGIGLAFHIRAVRSRSTTNAGH